MKYNGALPDDGSMRPETYRSPGTLKHYCNCKKVCVHFLVYIVTTSLLST